MVTMKDQLLNLISLYFCVNRYFLVDYNNFTLEATKISVFIFYFSLKGYFLTLRTELLAFAK